jgi:hypothetical protein
METGPGAPLGLAIGDRQPNVAVGYFTTNETLRRSVGTVNGRVSPPFRSRG